MTNIIRWNETLITVWDQLERHSDYHKVKDMKEHKVNEFLNLDN